MADSPDTGASAPDTDPSPAAASEPAGQASSDSAEYRVLARKYRPSNFDELVGQDVLVRTLTNAIRLNRVHHAFILTGVRGIGKTTTARIIARALNCVGPDGNGGPTINPCGVCDRCISIAEDRDVDVLEMDAASNTGVNDVREIIDSVRYTPVAARYKVYIIDEVHMLSPQAFNALLKTLEEPPQHVKFVFATTEIRKVPVTILSRCQRFDLRRLDEAELIAHLTSIASKEGASISADAIAVLARAADGSVRDGLSLLDQVIAQTDSMGSDADGGPDGSPDSGGVTADQARALLGMADRSQSLDLFEKIMSGNAATAIDQAGRMYRDGAAPLPVLQDLMDITHWMTRLKLTPGAEASGSGASQTDAARAAAMAEKLSMGTLTRAWQMLLKGVNEVQLAPQPMTALEMLIVRLCYVADLPTPGDIVARLEKGQGASASPPANPAPAATSPTAPSAPTGASAEPAPLPPDTAPGTGTAPTAGTAPAANSTELLSGGSAERGPKAALSRAVGDGLDHAGDPEMSPFPEPQMEQLDPMADAALLAAETVPVPADAGEQEDPTPTPPSGPVAPPGDFRALVNLFRDRKEMVLYGQLYNDVHLVSFDIGRLEIRPAPGARRELSSKVAAALKDWTDLRWIVTVSSDDGAPTLREQDLAAKQKLMDDAANDPLVRTVLDTFTGSTLTEVLEPEPTTGPAPGAPIKQSSATAAGRSGEDT